MVRGSQVRFQSTGNTLSSKLTEITHLAIHKSRTGSVCFFEGHLVPFQSSMTGGNDRKRAVAVVFSVTDH
jgi:hypothetical protein